MHTTSTTSLPAEELDFLGVRCRVIVDGDDTGGVYGLVDMIEVPAGDMPPLHIHHTHDEGFFLLEGELTLYQPGREITLRPGEFVLARRGVPHAYRVGDAPARWLVMTTPSGFEAFVRAVTALDVVSPDALGAIGAEHEIEILGPPGTLP
jgi:quercetin dioxygenase-like cupin family protein